MIRQAIATAQLESARADLTFLRYQAEPWTTIGERWLAEDRVWFWSLQVETGKLDQGDEPGEA